MSMGPMMVFGMMFALVTLLFLVWRMGIVLSGDFGKNSFIFNF